MTTTPKNARRRILPLALLAAASTLALTACGSGSGSSTNAAGTAPSASSTASSASSAGASTAPQSSAPAGTGSHGSGSGSGGGGAAGSPISNSGGSGNAVSDSYAYKHPCTAGQLSLKTVYSAQLGATKRLIEVTDTGSTACGLSYYPVVAIDNSSTVGSNQGTAQTVQPKVPGGLGGAPYHPLYAGHTAYAVVDLDPSRSTAGAGRGYDELSVIATSDLPDADTVNTKIVEEGGSAGNPYVKAPFLGLYEDSIAAAVSSANPANGG